MLSLSARCVRCSPAHSTCAMGWRPFSTQCPGLNTWTCTRSPVLAHSMLRQTGLHSGDHCTHTACTGPEATVQSSPRSPASTRHHRSYSVDAPGEPVLHVCTCGCMCVLVLICASTSARRCLRALLPVSPSVGTCCKSVCCWHQGLITRAWR